MRRLSIHRPNEKVRNPKRHIKSLEKWASSFKDYYPVRSKERYVNFKINTLDRLVQGPTSRYEWKQAAFNQLVIAAKNIVDSKPDFEKGKSWVAILLCYPNLWLSEVTVFFDKEYYESFIPHIEEIENNSILKKYLIKLPDNFFELGYMIHWNDEDENGNSYTVNQERWTIGEKVL